MLDMSREELLAQRSELLERLSAVPYEGTIEIKESEGRRYIYLRRRVDGRLTSRYIDVYSEERYAEIRQAVLEARSIRKRLRQIESAIRKLDDPNVK